jgi:hypothetical protein
MPTWKGSLPEEDLWAMVHFVDSLVALQGTEEGRQLRERLTEEKTPPKRGDE